MLSPKVKSLPGPTRLLAQAACLAAPGLWLLRHAGAPAVEHWTRPSLAGDTDGPLYARTGGTGETALVLLHGLVSTGDVFGAAFDQLAATHRMVVPDLLGFGRSMDESRSCFAVEAHLDALDQMAARSGLLDRRWTIGAHSMGSALALRWAARHIDRVDRVVCWGAPIYASPEAARTQISGTAMTRLFVLDTRWAERACAMSCRHRAVAGWVAAGLEPTLPVPIARAASLHTWPAYRDAMRYLVIETDWAGLLSDLSTNGTTVELVWGSQDRTGDLRYAQSLVAETSNAYASFVEGGGHHLPMTHPNQCRAQLTADRDDPPAV